MKNLFILLLVLCHCDKLPAQSFPENRNLIIITIDGYRWQELFEGADENLICNPQYVKDTQLMKSLYWDAVQESRRKKLMPFFWNVIATQGQLYGNRMLGNRMDVTNWYKISYPGYNEMLTGFPDPLFIPNIPLNNRNQNVLEYLNSKESYSGKVVAFTSWNIFPYILNEKRSKLPLNSGYLLSQYLEKDSEHRVSDAVQQAVIHKKNTRYDELTYINAREYIGAHHPRVVLLGFGETDECAHAGRYDLYLQKANNIDRMIADFWYYIQTDPYYKNNTTLLITTDHGRGSATSSWVKHGIFTKGSANTWLALLGPDIVATGEVKSAEKLYQKQLASTIAMLMGEQFEFTQPIGRPITLPARKSPEPNLSLVVTSK